MFDDYKPDGVWISRTDGKPVCIDCAFYDAMRKICYVNKKGGTSFYPSRCNFYKFFYKKDKKD